MPVRDVLRYLMYHDHYTELDARALYAELAPEVRSALPGLDYSQADGVCPRGLPIGSLMRAAGGLLA